MYRVQVYHRRLQLANHEFRTGMYTWYLNLDELPYLSRRHPWLLGINRPGIYTFRDSDHFRFWSDERKVAEGGEFTKDAENAKTTKTIKTGEDSHAPEPGDAGSGGSSVRYWLNRYFQEKGQPVPAAVYLLTNLRYLGYGFNPVSFYFALDESGRLYAILAEVNNTFGEQKPYLIVLDRPVSESDNKRIFARAWKNFYVSPFIDRDREFHFRMKLPSEKLSLGIDTYDGINPVLRAAYSGTRIQLSRSTMLRQMVRFPFVTIKVIALIHWHALLLFLKKVPFFGKEATDAIIQKEEHKRKEVTNAAV
tara:strand:+ start:632 stop:1552 length:921 start_codon:yes stop_codon:yes gene_type:complete